MAADEKFEAAQAMRRAMLGAEYVDAQASDPSPTLREFSDYLTSSAWGVWTRGGALSTRDRSLVVLAMTAAAPRPGWRPGGRCWPCAPTSSARADR